MKKTAFSDSDISPDTITIFTKKTLSGDSISNHFSVQTKRAVFDKNIAFF